MQTSLKLQHLIKHFGNVFLPLLTDINKTTYFENILDNWDDTCNLVEENWRIAKKNEEAKPITSVASVSSAMKTKHCDINDF